MKDDRLKVLVLSGGPSEEHDVSLRSGQQVVKNLDRRKYRVTAKVIGRHEKGKSILHRVGTDYDVVFIAMHGAFGEDGQIQSILAQARIPFTGSSSVSAHLSFDKAATNKKIKKAGVAIPNWKRGATTLRSFSLPYVIKPIAGGSSLGVRIIKKSADVRAKDLHNPSFMMQAFIKGMEVTCGVLERNGKPFALMPTEICPKQAEFFDYQSKYKPGATQEITPARLKPKEIKAIQKLSIRAHTALGCRGMSRSDFIFENGQFWYLETNAIPGLTKTSLLPQGAKAMGISYSQMLDLMIQAALRA